MPIVALSLAELLRALIDSAGHTATVPGRYGDAYEAVLPWQPNRIVELDLQWLTEWRRDIADAVAAVLPTFQSLMGYPAGDNPIGPPMQPASLALIEQSLPITADLALFCRVVGPVSLPDLANGWFVLSPLEPARIGPPYNVDIIRFASDGGGTVYAVPAGQSGPVLRLREVGEIGGVYDGNRIHVSAPHLRGFLAHLRDAITQFARTGRTTDL